MAKRGGPAHTLFQPGKSGNPGGLPRGYRDFDNQTLRRIFGKYAAVTLPTLEKFIADPESTVMELLVAKTIRKAIIDENAQGLAYLLDRYLPKPKEPAPEVTIDFSSMSTQQLLAMANDVIAGVLPPEERHKVITIEGTSHAAEKGIIKEGSK